MNRGEKRPHKSHSPHIRSHHHTTLHHLAPDMMSSRHAAPTPFTSTLTTLTHVLSNARLPIEVVA